MKEALQFLVVMVASVVQSHAASPVQLDINSQEILHLPKLSKGQPAAGKRVIVTPREYRGTEVFHTIYLPKNWTSDGPKLPIIFEFTGNYFPRSGSTGEVEDAGLGYGLSGGRYIWVSLPYVSEDHQDNERTWWGDAAATVAYAKRNVPRIIREFNADPDAVFLCGFSRGAIGVNYLGLHDDEISKLWTAFIPHDHFDGIKAWGRPWGSPLAKYREESLTRLKRVNGRPYLVSQNGSKYGTKEYLETVLPDISNFTFSYVVTTEALGKFPNKFAKTSHNDNWTYKPSKYRKLTWQWMNQVVSDSSSKKRP
jgi:hypothetical protein